MTTMFEILFFVCLGVLVYAHGVYPMVVWVWSGIKKKPHQKKEWVPDVTLVVPFYNEDKVIEDKLRNVKNLEYPEEKLQVLFVDDGSKGKAAEVIEREKDSRIELIRLEEHRGKPAALNEAMREARGEIVVFSDVSGMMNEGAVKSMVENFYDENVGAVLGIYQVDRKRDSRFHGAEEKYWDFELFLKKRESLIGNTLGGHGALYALRKELFEPLDERIINDDFVIPARVALKGYRTVYEERSVLLDCISTEVSEEFKRRIRIAYGNWQQMKVLGRGFLKRGGLVLWQFLSHKAIRTIQGLLLSYMVVFGFFVRSVVTDVFLILMGLLFAGGMLGLWFKRLKVLKGLNVFSFLVLVIGGQIVGSFYYFIGKRIRW